MAGIIIWFGALAAMFYVLIVRPQKKRIVAHQQLMGRLAVGDKVVTAGGLFGRVAKLDDDRVELEVASGVTVTVTRNSITKIEEPAAMVTQ